MSKVSFIIPARAEKIENVMRTLDSIRKSAKGEYEVIIGFDGLPNYSDLNFTGDLKIVNFPSVVGIKTNINTLAAMATGDYLFKCDAHCSFGEGMDEILKASMEEDWIVMPRFKIIRDDWSIQLKHGQEEFYDYFFLSCPFTDPRGFRFKAGGHWPERTKERDPFDFTGGTAPSATIDETPQIHGSGWFMSKNRFFELGGFPIVDPYGHAQEPLWLALKNWLKGGKVMVNKNTWYAHLHQDKYSKGFALGSKNEERTYNITATYWLSDKYEERIHNFEWFVDKFMPMPTWPDDWRERLSKWKEEHNGS